MITEKNTGFVQAIFFYIYKFCILIVVNNKIGCENSKTLIIAKKHHIHERMVTGNFFLYHKE